MSYTKEKAISHIGVEAPDIAPPRINLSSSEDVRREMARLYREARSSQIEPSQATKLVFILSQILRAQELVVLEGRLSKLEKIKIV